MKKRLLWRVVRWVGLVLLLAIAVAVIDGWRAFGRTASGARRARMEASPQWKDGSFVNPQPIINIYSGMIAGLLSTSDHASPSLEQPMPFEKIDPAQFNQPARTGVRITWLGHSTKLLELDGYRVLMDPIWSERAGPLSWIGPRRWVEPLISIEQLPPIDAVLVSHDHYDHFDYRTISALNEKTKAVFYVPLGVGSHLEYWGVPLSRIVELDWWESGKIRELQIVAVPARHASGRTLFDQDGTLWAGYALLGPLHRAYYSGDTGLFPAMKEIGDRYGPFDLTMIECGQYHGTWPDWHIGPEQAVIAHRLVRGRVMMPTHWGLLQLAYHGWTEPIERAVAAAKQDGAKIIAPKLGQTIEPDEAAELTKWWPKLSWQTGAEAPIVSSQMTVTGTIGSGPRSLQ